MLERIGALNERHTELDGRVVEMEEIMPTKADKSDLDGLSQGQAIPDDLLDQLEKLKEALAFLEKDKERIDDLLRNQQDNIDSMLSMGRDSRTDGESSGYESSGGLSAVDIRKIEIACQRLGHKLGSHVK
uniref:Uncharacterized protein n=1 Tax=Ciona savignyi TaxID=51511 RepID=H2YWU0_CIOSA